MVTTGGTGVAVPAGFDIKSIGGEIYEGGAILEKLSSLIANGMKYPLAFQQSAAQENEQAWIAWIVTYGTDQKLLSNAVESQLWRRHLYCKYGTERKVPKQGVPVDKQEVEPMYVPRVGWKSEGKWHIQQKIEQLTRLLNVANPVSAELKLEIEEDVARTLGYSEVNLDEARKVLNIHQDLEMLDAEIDKIKAEMILASLEKAMGEEMHLEMIPIITGLSTPEPEPEEQPKRPPPTPLARLAGGVSRTPKPTGKQSQKGVAKPMGGTRKPKPKPAGAEESFQFESDMELFEARLKGLEFETEMEMKEDELEIKKKEFELEETRTRKDMELKDIEISLKNKETEVRMGVYKKMIDMIDGVGGE